MRIRTIGDYMSTVRAYMNDEQLMQSIRYTPDDRDMGYRSALKYLSIVRSKNTDLIANRYIYATGEAREETQTCFDF